MIRALQSLLFTWMDGGLFSYLFQPCVKILQTMEKTSNLFKFKQKIIRILTRFTLNEQYFSID